jgi:hypothetical protein
VDLILPRAGARAYRFRCRVAWSSKNEIEFGLAVDELPGRVRALAPQAAMV